MTDISGEINDFKSDLKIRVESQESVLYEIVGENVGEDEPDSPDIIIRPTYLPVPLRIDSGFSQGRINKDKVKDNIDKESLLIFLSNIFRKK